MTTSAVTVRVLVVEDDDELRDGILVPTLREHGFDATGLGSAAALYDAMPAFDPHIVVLDIGLPDESGLSVARRLRRSSPVGIVMLTGLREEPDHVRGLANGADIYLAKPVSQTLLVATLRSLARRLDSPASGSSLAGWRLDAAGWRLSGPDGQAMDLVAAERVVLGRLLANAGTPVTREVLIADLSSDDGEEFDPHRLEMIVYRLRRRAATTIGTELPVRTVRGVGYLFAAGES